MAKHSAFALVLLIIGIVGIFLYKKSIDVKEGFAPTTITGTLPSRPINPNGGRFVFKTVASGNQPDDNCCTTEANGNRWGSITRRAEWCPANSEFVYLDWGSCTDKCYTWSGAPKTGGLVPGCTCKSGWGAPNLNPAANQECVLCTAGQYSFEGAPCSNCPAGKYQDVAGSASCKDCPPGQYQNLTGQSSCQTCPSGKTSSGGATSADACTCVANTYGTSCTPCPTANVVACTASGFTCQTGYYSNAGACTACPANTVSCTSATSFTCAAGFSNTGTACQTCPPGYACPGTTNTICPTGKYSPGGLATCSNCPPTTFAALTGRSNCTSCPSNSTCFPGGAAENQTGLTSFLCEETKGWSTGTSNCLRTKFATKMPYYTQGTIEQINNTIPYYKNEAKTQNNTVGCDTTDPPTCFYNWKTGPGTSIIGPSSSNPCPARNSWYDFAQEKCVNGLGNEVLTMNPCGSNTVYSLRDNACVQVRVPFAKQPDNTIGLPSLTDPGDFSNCQTVDRGDCTPYYSNANGTFTTINPCPPGSPYNFITRSCSENPLIAAQRADSNRCCGRPASELYTDATCSNYVNKTITYTKNTDLCPGDLCCLSSRKELAECSNYWTRTSNYTYKPSYNALCGIAGFEDYDNSIDTMASKRLQWLQRRQLINA